MSIYHQSKLVNFYLKAMFSLEIYDVALNVLVHIIEKIISRT